MLAPKFYCASCITFYAQVLFLSIILIKWSIVCLVKIIDRDIQHYKFFLIAGIVLITYLIPQSREYWKACFLIKSQTTYSNINLSAQFLPPLIPTVFFSSPTSLFKTLEITFLHIYFSDHNSMSLLQDWLP